MKVWELINWEIAIFQGTNLLIIWRSCNGKTLAVNMDIHIRDIYSFYQFWSIHNDCIRLNRLSGHSPKESYISCMYMHVCIHTSIFIFCRVLPAKYYIIIFDYLCYIIISMSSYSDELDHAIIRLFVTDMNGTLCCVVPDWYLFTTMPYA